MSGEPKFTPGPWHPGHLGNDSTCQCAHVVDEGYAGGICTVHIGNGRPIGEGGNDAPPREQAIANMHLIASAPAMFEALLSARQTILELKNSRWSECEGSDEEWVGEIDAALSTATQEGEPRP